MDNLPTNVITYAEKDSDGDLFYIPIIRNTKNPLINDKGYTTNGSEKDDKPSPKKHGTIIDTNSMDKNAKATKIMLSFIFTIILDTFPDCNPSDKVESIKPEKPLGDNEFPRRVSTLKLPTEENGFIHSSELINSELNETYEEIKEKLDIKDCVKEVFGDETYTEELKEALKPLSLHADQMYKFRRESIKGKFPLTNSCIILI